MKRGIVIVMRVLVGGFFLISGILKLRLHPAEVDAYIRSYDVLPFGYTYPVALVLPWVEIIPGALLVAGILPFFASSIIMAMLGLFILLLIWTILRGIPIEDCGCLPGLLQETPWTALLRDVILLSMNIPVWLYYGKGFQRGGRS